MLHYALKSAIPTESLSKGLTLDGSQLLFSSNTYIYRVKDGEYTISGILERNIRQIVYMKSIIYAITEDSLVLIYDNKNIASLKCDASCLLVSDQFIVLGTDNTLEVWYTPKEYKFGMFDLHSKAKLHNDTITCTAFLNEEVIITGSEDCSVKLYNIRTKTSDRFINTKSSPVKIFKIHLYIVVVCAEGQIYYVNEHTRKIDHKIYKNTKLTAADQYKDIICICLLDNNKSKLEIISDKEVIYGLETSHLITEINMDNLKVGVKSKTFVGIYNFEIDTFVFNLDLPRISCLDISNDLYCVGCADKKIRVYDDRKVIKVLSDEKNTHPLLNVYFLSGSVLSISVNGYISLFDMKNGTCFRSFNIPVKISATAICDDGMLLFIADYETYKIRIIDLQRSREIDSLEGHEAPVKNLFYSDNFLFSLSVDNELRKWDIYKSDCITANLEKTATNLVVRNSKIYISLINEIVVYDFNLEYDNSLFFKSERPAEHLDLSFDGKLLFLGGEFNRLYILDIASNNIEQTVKLSRNIRWKNYREVLFKNQQESCDKSEVIEILKMVHSKNQYKISYLTREGVFTYQKSASKYLPLCLDLETTTEAIDIYLKDDKFINALIVSLRLKDINYIKNILEVVLDNQVEFIVKFVPTNMVDNFRVILINFINDNFNILKSYKWMRYLIYYHGKGNYEQKICKKTGESGYKLTLENTFILESLIE